MIKLKSLITEIKRKKYKKTDWKKYNKLVQKGKDIMIQTAYGDHFSWDTANSQGVWGLDSNGGEIELTHNDIDQVEIY